MSALNVYCDESGHLEHDHQPVMVLGALVCPTSEVRRISEQLRALRESHHLSSGYEAKWTKVSNGQLGFYRACIDLFFSEPCLSLRCVVIPNKSALNHRAFGQTHDDWYYKMFYETLKFLINKNQTYRIFLDIKDSRGGSRTRKLHDVLCKSVGDNEKRIVQVVQQIRSHESRLLQLTDIFIGAIGYRNRNTTSSPAKLALIEHIEKRSDVRSITSSSRLSDLKFNLFVWSARER